MYAKTIAPLDWGIVGQDERRENKKKATDYSKVGVRMTVITSLIKTPAHNSASMANIKVRHKCLIYK